ncbi:hypothetical protein [Actinoplanes xinjiangensis]|jgi:hypothetical protein|uniref:Uncharacterized protein n=1 Tax=Actinoplanes xinjiangensis TaxID=512350 RepID=A0A316ETG3_9ACTN|nr:hypothetical protein [Actinoplanes xinjiangensis]PWK35898.1 hypothetical protein BC793_12599 [Actinoplanes xinjiangensis]GIF43081.1 hypothetical protein Axi01nite_73920 [Actinoplanes xinjiangensis]
MMTSQEKRPGLWSRFWGWLKGAPASGPTRRSTEQAPPPPSPLPPLTQVADAGQPLAIPAMGEAYDFEVQVEATWTAVATDLDALNTRSGRQAEGVRQAVRDKIWQVGRSFGPHEALDAERAMTERLPHELCFTDTEGSLRCSVKVRVRPDARVIQHLLPYSQRYLDAVSNQVLLLKRADLVEELADRWRDVLAEFLDQEVGDLVLPYAAQLTDKSFAVAVSGLESDRRTARAELAEVLDRAAKSHTRVGLFEFAETYEAALLAFRRSQGLAGEIGDAS